MDLMAIAKDLKAFEETLKIQRVPKLQERLNDLAKREVYLKKDEETCVLIEQYFAFQKKLPASSLTDVRDKAKNAFKGKGYVQAFAFYNELVLKTSWDSAIYVTSMAYRGLCLAAVGQELGALLDIQCATSLPSFPTQELHMYYMRLGQIRMGTEHFQGASWAFHEAITAMKTYLDQSERLMWERKCSTLIAEADEKHKKKIEEWTKADDKMARIELAVLKRAEEFDHDSPAADECAYQLENLQVNACSEMDERNEPEARSMRLDSGTRSSEKIPVKKEDMLLMSRWDSLEILRGPPEETLVGASLIVTKDVDSGDLLGTDDVVCSVINPMHDWNIKYCWECFTFIDSLLSKAIPCEWCNFVRFCSPSCFRKGKPLHEKMCKFLPVIMTKNIVWGSLKGLVFTSLMSRKPEQWAKLLVTVDERLKAAHLKKNPSEDPAAVNIDWSKLTTGEEILGHADFFGLDAYRRRNKCDQLRLAQIAEDILKVYLCTDHWLKWTSLVPGREKAAFYFVGHLIPRMLASMLSYGCIVDVPRPEREEVLETSGDVTSSGGLIPERIGLVLPSRFGYAKQSCFPNAMLLFEGKKAQLRALRTIKKGEAVSTAASWPYLRKENLLERRIILLARFGVECDCISCRGISWNERAELVQNRLMCVGCQADLGCLETLGRSLKTKWAKRKACICPTPGCKKNYRDTLTHILNEMRANVQEKRLVSRAKADSAVGNMLFEPSDLCKRLEYAIKHLTPASPYLHELLVTIGSAYSLISMKFKMKAGIQTRRTKWLREMMMEVYNNFPTFKPSTYDPLVDDEMDEAVADKIVTSFDIAIRKELARALCRSQMSVEEIRESEPAVSGVSAVGGSGKRRVD